MTPRLDPDALEQAIQTRFACTRCGHCCKGDGQVRLGPAEADRLAAALGLAREAFVRQYALRAGRDRWRLKDRWVSPGNPMLPDEQWCIFLERDPAGLYGCRVNGVKPDQCAGFPARWRNPDSIQTCPGLRRLAAELDPARAATEVAVPAPAD